VLGRRERGVKGGKAGPGRGHRKTAGNASRLGKRNDSDYVLARLRRDRPDLAAAVQRGAMSANAAAIEAGFREKMISIPLNPQKAAAALRRRQERRRAHLLEAVVAAKLRFPLSCPDRDSSA
jgi:hypothetical protein